MKANITLILLLLFSTLLSKDKSSSHRIFATGELHGAIEESSIKKSGGVVGMSHFLKRNLLTTDLLLDAGGFTAGGLYDFGISGYLSDSLRTDIICSQISVLNYTAITFGDDDLAWGAHNITTWQKRYSLPLVSANVSFTNGEKILPYIYLKEKNIFITGVTTSKPLVPPGENIVVDSPINSLAETLSSTPKDATVILLAHLTPEEIDSVLTQFPQIDIVVRGHRQGGEEVVDTVHNRPVLSFGFEGTRIVSAEISKSGEIGAEWIPIEAKPFSYELPQSREIFDLVVMSGCPYASAAIDQMLTFSEKSEAFQWNLWFSGTIQGDSLLPGLSSGDLNWELSVLAVQQLYPKRFHDFLWLLNQEYTVEKALEEMQLSASKIEEWIQSHGRDLLRLHYRRSDRLAVISSPTLFINNRLYNGEVDSNRFLFELCKRELERAALCGSFGECLTDSDCSSSNGVARCEESSTGKRCVTHEDVAFKIIQILPDDSGYSAENSFTQTTKNLFPKAEVRTIRQSSPEAEEILETFNAATLPFYLIDTAIVTSINYHSVAEGIERRRDHFTFRPGFMTGSFYLKRTDISGDIKLFVDIESELYPMISQENLRIYPAFSKEMLLNDSPQITSLLKELKIADSPETYFRKYLEDIVVGAPVYVLYNNNQIREIHSQAEFETFLQEDMK